MAEDTGSVEAAPSDADAVAGAVTEAAAATQTPTEPVAAPSAAWQWALGVPGEGNAPDWFKTAKYTSVEDQAKAYPELEKRLGSFTGAPDEFTINLSDEVKESGLEISSDDPIMEEAFKFAKESNMSQEGFDKLMNLHAMSELARGKAQEEQIQTEIASLGDRGQDRLNNLDAWAKANLPEDMQEGFSDMAVSANAIKAMEKIIAMSRNSQVNPAEVSAVTAANEEEVRAMQFEKDQYGNRRIQTDKSFKSRYEKLRDQVYGTEENRIIIG